MTIDVRAISSDDLESEDFPAVEQAFRIVIGEKALDRAVERGSKDTSREIGGILVGVLRRDDSGPYVFIEETIDARHAEEKGAELTFTHDTWEHINKEMDSRYEDKKILGWYHTHPGFGIFLSEQDQFIHKSFFDLPFQIALVYDPKSREHGVFAWAHDEPTRVRRYWVGSREHVWDGNRAPEAREEPAAAPAGADTKSAPAQSEGLFGERVDWASVAFIGLMLLAIGGIGGWWFQSRTTESVVMKAQLEAQQARAAGAAQMVAQLNGFLLRTVRAALDHSTTVEGIKESEGELKLALGLLEANKNPGNAVVAKHIEDAIATLKELQSNRTAVAAALLQLERSAARARDVLHDARQAAIARSALAALYADLAASAISVGDTRRARRYLDVAAKIDPDNAKRYRRQAGRGRRPKPKSKTKPKKDGK